MFSPGMYMSRLWAAEQVYVKPEHPHLPQKQRASKGTDIPRRLDGVLPVTVNIRSVQG